jgi:DNA-binding MarR family transcriptional regulator
MATTDATGSEKRTEVYTVEQSGAGPLEHEAFLSLVRTASRLEGELNRLFRSYELTNATYNILRALEPFGVQGLSCGDIAQRLIAEVPDMTRLLDRLERLGYVDRHRSEVDRRMVKVTLTAKGSSVLGELKGPVEECHKRQMNALDRNKLQELLSLLKQVSVTPGEGARLGGTL